MKKFVSVFSIILLIILVSSLFLPRKNENSVNDNNNTDISIFSELSYISFGDSITAGAGLDVSETYPSVVADILNLEKVINKGRGGSTYVLNDGRGCIQVAVEDVAKLPSKYDIISVAGGINDWDLSNSLGTIKDYTNTTIYGSLHIIAKTLKSTYPDAFIFFMTPLKKPTFDRENDVGYILEDVANAVKDVAQIYDIPVLDLFSTSQFETADVGMSHPDCDGTHPIKEFVADYMAPQIAQFIKDNYKK